MNKEILSVCWECSEYNIETIDMLLYDGGGLFTETCKYCESELCSKCNEAHDCAEGV